ncbi:MAG: hypothetical protein ACKVVP_12650, partial [Chloroflexota bacterium]
MDQAAVPTDVADIRSALLGSLRGSRREWCGRRRGDRPVARAPTGNEEARHDINGFGDRRRGDRAGRLPVAPTDGGILQSGRWRLGPEADGVHGADAVGATGRSPAPPPGTRKPGTIS